PLPAAVPHAHVCRHVLFLARRQHRAALEHDVAQPAGNGRLVYDVDFLTLGPAQDIGAALLSFWIYLTIGMLGAFAISFYFSSNTIIYFLMRHEVDATELDDVYLEQADDEFAETAPATTVSTTTTTVVST